MLYQTHDDNQRGMSDSAHKLERLKIPADLSGNSVLDIGCNEGYFCNIAASRGASKVIGIDAYAPSISDARKRYGAEVIEFRHQNWRVLPEGKFDLVIWSSAMHYEKDPALVLWQIEDRLTQDGLLILECGVYWGATKEMAMVQRHSDVCWYPTERFLHDHLLSRFAFRSVAAPEAPAGDPVPRHVYHCHRRLPIVFLLRGRTHDGKSSAGLALEQSATKLIGLDLFAYRVAKGQYHHDEVQRYLRDNHGPFLTEVYDGIDLANLTEQYAKLLADSVARTDRTVVIEGYMTDPQAEALTRRLEGRAIVWDASRFRSPS